LDTCWWGQCHASYNWSAWNFVFTERVSWAAKAEWSVKPSSLLKLHGCKWIYAVSFTVQSTQLIVYLICMYCWSLVLKPGHAECAISRWLMCFSLVLLVVLLTVLTYALPISHGMMFMPRFLTQASLVSLSMWTFFLTQMWTVLVPLLACSLLIFLSFHIVMVARQLLLWVSYSVPVACFSGQGFLDILMTTTNILLTSNTYMIKKCWNVLS